MPFLAGYGARGCVAEGGVFWTKAGQNLRYPGGQLECGVGRCRRLLLIQQGVMELAEGFEPPTL